MDPLGLTSSWVAAARASESARPDRLFDDPFAAALAGDEGRAFFREMEQIAGRTDRTRTSPSGPRARRRPSRRGKPRHAPDRRPRCGDGRARATALLAGGHDRLRGRARRRPRLQGVDPRQPPRNLARPARARSGQSAQRLARRAARRPPRSCPTDRLSRRRAALLPAGRGGRARHPVRRRVDRSPRKQRGARPPRRELPRVAVGQSLPRRRVAAKGAPWSFGSDEPEALLQRAGWKDVRAAQPGEAGAWPERWPHPVPPRDALGFPHTFFVFARR